MWGLHAIYNNAYMRKGMLAMLYKTREDEDSGWRASKGVWAFSSQQIDDEVETRRLRYFNGKAKDDSTARRLYSGLDIEKLALKLHGSREGMVKASVQRYEQDKKTWEGQFSVRHFVGPSLGHNMTEQIYNPSLLLDPDSQYYHEDIMVHHRNPIDKYRCMGSTYMPVLTSKLSASMSIEEAVFLQRL